MTTFRGHRSIFLALIGVLLCYTPAQAAVTHVVSTSATTTDTHSITTAAVDTSGANFIVLAVTSASFSISAPTDSKSNTWNALTQYPTTQAFAEPALRLYYCYSCTVGSGHTFTAPGTSNYPGIAASAYATVQTSPDPFDQQGGWTGFPFASTAASDGNVTPSVDNEVFIAAVAVVGSNTINSINSSFTIATNTPPEVSHPSAPGIALAYQIQTTATARNPTWTFAGDNYFSDALATFKEGGAPPPSRPCCLGVF